MTDIVPTRDPWERLGEESTADYSMFVEFCKLGPRRTTRSLAAHVGMSPGRVSHLARKNSWAERAEAYDIACNQLVPNGNQLSLEDTLAFQYAVGQVMLDFGVKALQMKNPGSIKSGDIVRMLKEGADIQRRAIGITDTVSIKVESETVGKLNEMLQEIIEADAVEEDD